MNLFTFYFDELLSNNVKSLAHFPLNKKTLTHSTVVQKHPWNILALGIKGVLSFVKNAESGRRVCVI